MSRQVLVQCYRADKSRTSVSIHSTLFALAERHYKGKDRLLSVIRRCVRDDAMDSWAVASYLLVNVARPSLCNGQIDIED